MKKMSLARCMILNFSVIAVLTGCTAKYDRIDTGGTEKASASLDRSQAVLILVPRDGSYGEKTYQSSGQYVARQVAAAFSKYAKRVEISSASYTKPEDIYDLAEKSGVGYVVVPNIAHWEHRNTAWSGIPSRASVGINVQDIRAGKEVSSTLIEGRSRIMSWTSTSPESLISEPVGEYVNSLYTSNKTSLTGSNN